MYVPLENLSVTRNKNLICHKNIDKSYLVIDTLFLHQFCEITASSLRSSRRLPEVSGQILGPRGDWSRSRHGNGRGKQSGTVNRLKAGACMLAVLWTQAATRADCTAYGRN